MYYNGTNFKQVMAEHERWLESHGTDGSQAIFLDFTMTDDDSFFSYVYNSTKDFNIVLDKVHFIGVKFENAALLLIKFVNCTFDDVSFSNCSMISCMFYGCSTERMKFYSCSIFNSAFVETILRHSIWSKIDIYQTIFQNNNYFDAKFGNTTSFYNVDLHNESAQLESATVQPNIVQACPSHGSFIGWKKGLFYEERDDHSKIPAPTIVLIKLEIPEDAKRIGGYTNGKCRCSKAKVLEIRKPNGEKIDNAVAVSIYDGSDTKYKVGEMVYPDSFDDNRYAVCAHGIHFFSSLENALQY